MSPHAKAAQRVAQLNEQTEDGIYDAGFNDGKAERSPQCDDSTYRAGYQDGQNETLAAREIEHYNALQAIQAQTL